MRPRHSFSLFLVLAFLTLASVAFAQVPITQPIPVPGAAHPADVTVTVTPTTGDELTISGMRLHGVAWMDGRDPGPRLTFGENDGTGSQVLPTRQLIAHFGRDATWSATVHPTNRAPEDLCLPPADPERDAAPAANWCLRMKGSPTFSAGTTGYVGPIALPDSTVIRGNGATLRVLDGEAFAFLRPDSVLTDAQRVRRILGQDRTAIYVASGATHVEIHDLNLDGNDTADLDALSQDHEGRPTRNACLRNAPCHAGLVAGRHGGILIPGDAFTPGLTVVLRDVRIRGFASVAVLGDENARFDAERVHLSDAAWNHLLYDAAGHWRDLTLSGYAWTHAVLNGSGAGQGPAEPPDPGTVIDGLTVRELTGSPTGRNAGHVMDLRLGKGSVTLRHLTADLGDKALAFAAPYTRPAFDPTLSYRPPLDDPAYWAQIGDHTLRIEHATITTTSNRLLTLRREGPVTVHNVTLPASDSTSFRLALPLSRTSGVSATSIQWDAPTAPIETPDEVIRQLTARLSAAEVQIEDLTNQLATERAMRIVSETRIVELADELATAQATLEAIAQLLD